MAQISSPVSLKYLPHLTCRTSHSPGFPFYSFSASFTDSCSTPLHLGSPISRTVPVTLYMSHICHLNESINLINKCIENLLKSRLRHVSKDKGIFFYFLSHLPVCGNILLREKRHNVYIFFNFFLTFIHFLRDTGRQSMSGKGAERGRHRIQSRLQALRCQHRARRRARTHEL